MFHLVLKNPICFVFGICLLFLATTGIFFYDDFPKMQDVQYLIMVAFFVLLSKNTIHRLIATVFSLIIFLIYLFLPTFQLLLVAEALLVFFVFWQHKSDDEAITFLILALGFIFHFYYIQNSAVDQRQHDMTGVLYYMQKITQYGINWRYFDPWYMYYFFHQPFHFITAGYFYLIEYSLWNSASVAQEGLQYLSLFYITVSTIVASRIFKILELSPKIYVSTLLLFTFNPTICLLSGYITDDTAVFFWTILFIYFLIRWMYSERILFLIWAAICLGIGTLTKLSILVLVPSVCLLFLYKLYSSTQKKHILTGISIFIIIAVPLSLLWIVRNHILFDMPFYNIPDTAPNGQNFKYLSFGERITDFSSFFLPFINSPTIVESNMLLALIKTELFGEWDLSNGHTIITVPSFGLYLINILIKISAGIGGIFLLLYSLRKKISLNLVMINFFILTFYVVWIYALKYAMDYPYACSTDYRLFATLILPEIILLATLVNRVKVYRILLVVSILYSLLVCFIYTTIV